SVTLVGGNASHHGNHGFARRGMDRDWQDQAPSSRRSHSLSLYIRETLVAIVFGAQYIMCDIRGVRGRVLRGHAREWILLWSENGGRNASIVDRSRCVRP